MQHSGEEYLRGLREDHARFSRVLSMIGRDAHRLVDQPQEVLPLFSEAVDYVVNFQNVHHHPREEIMFARIAARSEALATTASKLSREHGATEVAGGELLSMMKRLSPAASHRADRARVARRLERFARSMRGHIAQEEQLLYSQAWSELTPEDWAGLAASAAAVDPIAPGDDPRYPLLTDYVEGGRTHSNVSTQTSPVGAVLETGLAQASALSDHLGAISRTAKRQSREAYALTRKAFRAMPLIPMLEPQTSVRVGIESAEALGRAYVRWLSEWVEIYRDRP
jgi:hemerythrin-like domain-containing protein